MVSLEKDGPILFVKPFPKPEALEIDSCLDAQENYVLSKICPDYSVTCMNREGKKNKQHLDLLKKDMLHFKEVVFMGKQCADMLDIMYKEWGYTVFHIGDHHLCVWFTPALGTMMTSNKRLKEFRAFVEKIRANL